MMKLSKEPKLKALDLIARLSALQNQFGDCEVWLEMDVIAPSADVEMWHRPFFDESTFMILAMRRNAPDQQGNVLPFDGTGMTHQDDGPEPEP
jgi:hypothetical protein